MNIFKLGSGLAAGVVVFVGALMVSENLFSPDVLEKPAYPIAIAEAAPASAVATTAVAASPAAPVAPAAPAFATGEAFEKLLAAADATKGANVAKKCAMCHDLSSGNANKIGPGLWGIEGRKMASHAGFTYSAALSAKNQESWTVDNLNHWLFNPSAFAKGNKMAFMGIKNDAERADLIAYLKTLK